MNSKPSIEDLLKLDVGHGVWFGDTTVAITRIADTKTGKRQYSVNRNDERVRGGHVCRSEKAALTFASRLSKW